MAISFVSAAVYVGSSSTTSHAVPRPAGAVKDDILLCAVCTYAGNQVITTHADWTNIHANVEADPLAVDGQSTEVTVARRTMTASEPSTWNFTTSVSTDTIVATVMAFRGVAIASPVRSSGTNTATSGTTLASPSLTGVQPADMVVLFGGTRPFAVDGAHHMDGPSSGGWTSPAAADTGPSSNAFGFPAAAAGSYQINGTTGTFTASSSSSGLVTVAVALAAPPNQMGRMVIA